MGPFPNDWCPYRRKKETQGEHHGITEADNGVILATSQDRWSSPGVRQRQKCILSSLRGGITSLTPSFWICSVQDWKTIDFRGWKPLSLWYSVSAALGNE